MKKNKLESNSLINKLVAVPYYLKLLRKYNTLESNYEDLKEAVKNDLFKESTKTINMQNQIDSLTNENKRLKDKIKEMKTNA